MTPLAIMIRPSLVDQRRYLFKTRQIKGPANVRIVAMRSAQMRTNDVPTRRFQSRELAQRVVSAETPSRPRKSEDDMKFGWQRPTALAIAVVAMLAAGAAVAVSRPHMVSEPAQTPLLVLGVISNGQ